MRTYLPFLLISFLTQSAGAQMKIDSVHILLNDIEVNYHSVNNDGHGTTTTFDTIKGTFGTYTRRNIASDSSSLDTLILISEYGDRTDFKIVFNHDTTIANSFIYQYLFQPFGGYSKEIISFVNASINNTDTTLAFFLDSAGLALGAFDLFSLTSGVAGSGGATYSATTNETGRYFSTSTVTVIFFKQFPSAVRSNEEIHSLNIYPNPATEFITVSAPMEIGSCTIYDMLGREVLMAKMQETTKINLSELHPGVYMLSVGGQMRKIVVE